MITKNKTTLEKIQKLNIITKEIRAIMTSIKNNQFELAEELQKKSLLDLSQI